MTVSLEQLEHKTYAASTTSTDQGLFTALVSTPEVDREHDVVARGAFATTIANWRGSGKMLPLAWNHGADPEDLVGYIDPAQMHEGKDGLTVGGKVDLDTDRGQQVWRLLKSGSLGFSFCFMATRERNRADGIREIAEVDVFEISATPTPMNAGTRVLSTKAATAGARHKAEMLALLAGGDAWDPDDALKVRAKALGIDELARRARPIQIATFDA